MNRLIHKLNWLAGLALIVWVAGCDETDPISRNAPSHEGPILTEVKKNSADHWELWRGGKPYEIRGAAGDGSLDLLVESGANSNRTWGVDETTQRYLDEAHEKGVSVVVGIWLEHQGKGFDYDDEAQVKEQSSKVMAAVRRFKDHPAVLMWGIGNEMEGYQSGDNPAIWNHVEELAKAIKSEDPNHPTMTVIAEIGGKKIPAIHQFCPSIDVIGINAYGGAASLPERYRKAAGRKPYIVTEYGPPGTWEVPKNNIDAIDELTSTHKAAFYRATYEKLKSDEALCLGSYAFLWGDKMEATPTWFGMLLPDGQKTAAVDVMTELWSGQPPANLCPRIESLTLEGPNSVDRDARITARLDASDPEGSPLNVNWKLMADAKDYITGGDFQRTPPEFPAAIVKGDRSGAEIQMPIKQGLYRLYAVVDDGSGGAAVANLAIRVRKPEIVEPGETVSLPYILYDEPGREAKYVPSGFMGSTDVISVDQACTDQPRSGDHCIQCQYSSDNHWGGVVWQHPENDWGELPGGLNLTGATKLTFWARGQDGGEEIKFGVGLLGEDAKYYDTTKHEQTFTLSDQWRQFTIDLSGSDLRRIKSGFFWSLAAQGDALTFYLDDILFE